MGGGGRIQEKSKVVYSVFWLGDAGLTVAPFTEMENKRGRIEFGGKMLVKLELLTGHPSGNGYMA